MASPATNLPSANAAETGAGLTNPNNAMTDDADYSTAAPGKNVTLATKYQNFGFAASLGTADNVKSIDKVELIYKWKCSTTSSVATARTYSKVSGSAGTNHDDATEPAGDTTNTYDITAERTWTYANLLDGTLEMVLAAVQGSSSTAVTFSFAFAKIRITYTVQNPVTLENYKRVAVGDGMASNERVK